MNNNDDFDVVKKGEVHQLSFDKGELSALRKLEDALKEVLKDIGIEIAAKEAELR